MKVAGFRLLKLLISFNSVNTKPKKATNTFANYTKLANICILPTLEFVGDHYEECCFLQSDAVQFGRSVVEFRRVLLSPSSVQMKPGECSSGITSNNVVTLLPDYTLYIYRMYHSLPNPAFI